MEAVPGPFRPATRHRVRDDPNEDETGKALPEMVIRQLDARLDLLGPAGRAGAIPAASMQLMHQTIYQILRDTGRRPGEVVTLRPGCIEVIDGQHNLIYDNHKAGRMRRRLPVTSATAAIILAWQQHRGTLRLPPAQDRWLFPSPLLRANQARGHITPSAVARAFKTWVTRIGVIDSELAGPDGTPVPFDRPSSPRTHCGIPTPKGTRTPGSRSTCSKSSWTTPRSPPRWATTRSGSSASSRPSAPSGRWPPTPRATRPRSPAPPPTQRASVSVPFGNCTEPSNVNAGGGACPIRFQCAGCGFYRPDPSYLPALEAAHRQPARRPGNRHRDRRRRLRHREPHRRDRRLHQRRRPDAPPARPLAPPSARKSSRPASSCAAPAPPGAPHHLPRHETA